MDIQMTYRRTGHTNEHTDRHINEHKKLDGQTNFNTSYVMIDYR